MADEEEEGGGVHEEEEGTHARPPPLSAAQASVELARAVQTGGLRLDMTQGRLRSTYDVGSTIGKGKFSTVFRATCKDGGGAVALKQTSFDILDARARDKCLKEIKLVQSLEHPNIVRFLDGFVDANVLYLVFEFAEAGDLKRQIRKAREREARFDERVVWKYFSQIAEAVAYMHSRRIMHRDLKPANIFLTLAGVVKVGDLGLGRFLSEETLAVHSKVGTPLYMSPEVLRGAGYEWSSDVWSLGCLLYELSMLRSPFKEEGINLHALFAKIAEGAYAPPSTVYSETLRNLVQACLHLDPAARPSAEAVAAIAVDMREATSRGKPLVAHAPTTTPTPAGLAPGGPRPKADVGRHSGAAAREPRSGVGGHPVPTRPPSPAPCKEEEEEEEEEERLEARDCAPPAVRERVEEASAVLNAGGVLDLISGAGVVPASSVLHDALLPLTPTLQERLDELVRGGEGGGGDARVDCAALLHLACRRATFAFPLGGAGGGGVSQWQQSRAAMVLTAALAATVLRAARPAPPPQLVRELARWLSSALSSSDAASPLWGRMLGETLPAVLTAAHAHSSAPLLLRDWQVLQNDVGVTPRTVLPGHGAPVVCLLLWLTGATLRVCRQGGTLTLAHPSAAATRLGQAAQCEQAEQEEEEGSSGTSAGEGAKRGGTGCSSDETGGDEGVASSAARGQNADAAWIAEAAGLRASLRGVDHGEWRAHLSTITALVRVMDGARLAAPVGPTLQAAAEDLRASVEGVLACEAAWAASMAGGESGRGPSGGQLLTSYAAVSAVLADLRRTTQERGEGVEHHARQLAALTEEGEGVAHAVEEALSSTSGASGGRGLASARAALVALRVELPHLEVQVEVARHAVMRVAAGQGSV